MDYQETYNNMHELTDDLFQLLRKLQNVAGKKKTSLSKSLSKIWR